ncbi:MAG TPA: ATP-binding protein [Myxococcales bacterium]|nr:ATP-binding protein [Myxococcales bacterium]
MAVTPSRSTPSGDPGRLKLRRQMLLTVVVAVVAFLPLDLIAGSTQTRELTLSRLLLLGTYGPSWWLLPRVSERAGTWLLSVVVSVTPLSVALLCMGTGGVDSPAFSFVWSWPLFAGLMFLEQPMLSLCSGASALLGGGWLLARAGKPPAAIAYWLMVTAVCTMIAAVATALYRRIHARELLAEQERAEAVRRLAEAERERARLEHLAFMGRLAAGVAHEVNNPLGFVKSNLGWLSQQHQEGGLVDDPEETAEVLGESLQGVTRIERIISGLRAFSGDRPEPCAEVAVAGAIRDALSAAAQRLRGTRVEVSVPPAFPKVRGSRDRLVEVLESLLLNASDALEERPPAQRWIQVSARVASGRIEIDVVDGGPGLPGHVLERLFQPFVTTKRAGMGAGLGLTIASEHMRRQGGSLEGFNAPGAGACFRVGLPPA